MYRVSKLLFSCDIAPYLVEGISTKCGFVTHGVRLFSTHNSLTGYEEKDLHREPESLPGFNGPKIVTHLSENGLLLSQMLLKVKSKKTRLKSGLILLEGKRLINDACTAGVTPEMIFYSRKRDVEEIKIPSGVKLYKTTYKELQLWSDLTTCPGVIAICKVPNISPSRDDILPITVICDQIREPGNLGSIIRNSAAAGASTIIVTPGCTDLWDSKVLRAGTGAHFKIPILKDETWDNISEILPENTKFMIADCPTVRGGNVNLMPLTPYYSLNYQNYKHLTVVIGGETEGLSDDAIRLAHKLNGNRITIPMSNNIESLNSAAAVSVILFEVRRQMVV